MELQKFWFVIPIIGAVIWYNYNKNNLVIENLQSDSPFLAATTVKATLYNRGAGDEYGFHVTKGSSKIKYCSGRLFIGENERRRISFKCSALTGYTGRFKLITRRK